MGPYQTTNYRIQPTRVPHCFRRHCYVECGVWYFLWEATSYSFYELSGNLLKFVYVCVHFFPQTTWRSTNSCIQRISICPQTTRYKIQEFKLFHSILNHAFANYGETEDMPKIWQRKKVYNQVGHYIFLEECRSLWFGKENIFINVLYVT